VLEVFPDAQLDIIGAGDILQELKSLSYALEIDHAVTFHGHLNQSEFRSILERSCLGVAPFLRTPTSFSTFADPSKIKSYIEAGLPVLMSDVPEIARTLSEKQCGVICEPDESSIAEAIVQILSSREDWMKLAQNVRDFSVHLDWRETLKPLNLILTRI
jgi:glycosyltransferase involved in cell wall biosynthesis